jgi:hypothetical protein
VYGTSSVDVAVASLNAAVRGAIEQAIPCGYSCKSKFPHWFSYTLKCYFAKKNYFHRRFKKKPPDYFRTGSPITGNLLKAPSSPTGLGG